MRALRRFLEQHRRVRTAVVVVALGLAAWWVLVAPVPHGALLIRFSTNHGLDASDLAAIPFLALVGWIVRPPTGWRFGAPAPPKAVPEANPEPPTGR